MAIPELLNPNVVSRESLKYFLDGSPEDSPFKKKRQKDLLDGIFQASKKYSLNPVYILAHAIHESGWGRSKISKDKNNLFGYRAYDVDPYGNAMKFKDYIECIDFVMERVKKDYLSPLGRYFNGISLQGMNKCYATDQGWCVNIKRLMNEVYKSDHKFTEKK